MPSTHVYFDIALRDLARMVRDHKELTPHARVRLLNRLQDIDTMLYQQSDKQPNMADPDSKPLKPRR